MTNPYGRGASPPPNTWTPVEGQSGLSTFTGSVKPRVVTLSELMRMNRGAGIPRRDSGVQVGGPEDRARRAIREASVYSVPRSYLQPTVSKPASRATPNRGSIPELGDEGTGEGTTETPTETSGAGTGTTEQDAETTARRDLIKQLFPNFDLTSYSDEDFQNLPTLRYLSGLLDRADYNRRPTETIEGPFGTDLPLSGLINMYRMLNVMTDPDSMDMLRSLYRGANLNLDAEIAKAMLRAPTGAAIPTSGVMT